MGLIFVLAFHRFRFNIWNTGPGANFDQIAHLAKLAFSTKGVVILLTVTNERSIFSISLNVGGKRQVAQGLRKGSFILCACDFASVGSLSYYRSFFSCFLITSSLPLPSVRSLTIYRETKFLLGIDILWRSLRFIFCTRLWIWSWYNSARDEGDGTLEW